VNGIAFPLVACDAGGGPGLALRSTAALRAAAA
jgi:hypothetical protein